MIFKSFKRGYLLPMLAVWTALISLLASEVSGLSQHKVKAPSLPAVSTATSKSDFLDQDTGFTTTKTPVFRENHEHINDLQKEEIPPWTTVQPVQMDQTSVGTFETMTRLNSGPANTILPRDPSSIDEDESDISGSASAPTSTTTPGHDHDLKRSTGTFMMVKGVLISWAILLVGMLTYAAARYSEEAFSEEPVLDTPPAEYPEVEHREYTTLLDHDNV